MESIGKRLAFFRKLKNLKQSQMAVAIDKDLSSYKRYEYDQVTIPASVAKLLEVRLGLNPVWLSSGSGDITSKLESVTGDMLLIPVYKYEAQVDLFFAENNKIGNCEFPLKGEQAPDFMILIKGSSFEPVFMPDDMLAVKKVYDVPDDGIYLYKDSEGLIDIKTVTFQNGDNVILSFNGNKPVLTDKIDILGQIVWYKRMLFNRTV